MKRQKLNITQVGDMNEARKTWKKIASTTPEIMRCTDLNHYGRIVFEYAHLKDSTQVIGFAFFDENKIKDVNVAEMAQKLRNRHVGVFYISSLNDNSFDFEVYFIFNEERTAIESIICVDFTISAICFIDDKSTLSSVLRKLMRLDSPFTSHLDFSAN